jgi:hypothetical protein
MASIKAYIYNTQGQANTAINSINNILGIPVSVDAVTQTYTDIELNNGKYIIKHDEVIEGVLGLPSDFEYVPPIIENPFV